jgi:2-dehydropantoate 2-reductase
MRILVVGAGATGGFFGGRLAEIGRDVSFLVRPKRAEALRRRGLEIVSPRGNATLHAPFVTTVDLSAPYDLVILGVKAYALDAAIADMSGAVGPDTMILPLLNGMRHIDLLVQRFGEDAILGGFCMCITTLDDEGRIEQTSTMARIGYGERNRSTTERVRAVHAQMQGAAFAPHLSPDILQDMWEKWVMLATNAGTNCLMRGTLGEVAGAPGGTAFARRLLAECAAIAAAAGHPPAPDYLRATEAALGDTSSPQTSSMYRDMLRNAPVEGEHILGDLQARAEKAGIDVPLIATVRTHLAVYQRHLG